MSIGNVRKERRQMKPERAGKQRRGTCCQGQSPFEEQAETVLPLLVHFRSFFLTGLSSLAMSACLNEHLLQLEKKKREFEREGVKSSPDGCSLVGKVTQ